MNRFRWMATLMIAAILGITGFQLYWLQQNYTREKKALAIKTEMAFRETMLELQVAKLKLDGMIWSGKDSAGLKIMVKGDPAAPVHLPFRPKEEIVSTINVIRDKVKDSVRIIQSAQPKMMIRMNNSTLRMSNDSVRLERTFEGTPGEGGGSHIFNLLYGVDSLQEPLRLSEIDSAYQKRLHKEKLNVPYTILEKKEDDGSRLPRPNVITVGFSHPVSYQLQLGNTVPYLLKQLLQPMLFSLLLLGLTIMSFVLLYRSLLRQRRLAVLKNEFISNITHELKTPIATVGVAIEALKNFNAIQDPQRTKEYLDISQNELQRLGLLVDKVLKLSMFEKKEVELKYETVNLQEIVEEVVNSLKLQLEKYHARVTVNTAGNPALQADRLHLLSVIFNLLDNALKYSREEPSIQIELKEKDTAVEMQLTDNGIGIPEEYRDKIFDKFFRVPQGDTHNAKGYGLGLSYVAEVVRKHQGAIQVESQAGIGTRFIITIPKQPQ